MHLYSCAIMKLLRQVPTCTGFSWIFPTVLSNAQKNTNVPQVKFWHLEAILCFAFTMKSLRFEKVLDE